MALGDENKSLTRRGLSGLRAGWHRLASAGPEISPPPAFTPGSYSPAAAAANAAVSFISGVRSANNYRQRLAAARVDMEFKNAQTEHMRASTDKLNREQSAAAHHVPINQTLPGYSEQSELEPGKPTPMYHAPASFDISTTEGRGAYGAAREGYNTADLMRRRAELTAQGRQRLAETQTQHNRVAGTTNEVGKLNAQQAAIKEQEGRFTRNAGVTAGYRAKAIEDAAMNFDPKALELLGLDKASGKVGTGPGSITMNEFMGHIHAKAAAYRSLYADSLAGAEMNRTAPERLAVHQRLAQLNSLPIQADDEQDTSFEDLLQELIGQ